MMTAALISLRETLETSLVIGLILAVLSRLRHKQSMHVVWLGVGCGLVWSALFALILSTFAQSLGDEAREVYEGILMIVAAGLLTWMVVWMMRTGSTLRQSMEHEVAHAAIAGEMFAIFLLSFTTTAREGTEMVLFLNAALISAGSNLHHLAGVLLGITGALLLTVMVFRGTKKFSLRLFFRGTSILLLLFAVSLIISGIEELMEAGVF